MGLFEIQSVLHTKNALHFKWSDLGGTYFIYRDRKLVYEGPNASFQDETLVEGKIYNYVIERILQNEIVDVIHLQTSGYTIQETIDNPLDALMMTVAVSRAQVVLFWEEIPNVTRYEVYKNDVLVKELDKNYYIDIHPEIDEIVTYRIQSTRPVLKSKTRFNKSKMVLASVFGVATSWSVEPAIEIFTLVKEVRPVSELLKPMAKREKMCVNRWKFRYTTFIKEEKIENPNVFSKRRLFRGDGRNFHPSSSSYRSRVDVSLDYHNQIAPMSFDKRIGKTVSYDRFGKVKEVAVATDKDINIKKYEAGGIGFSIMHDVCNPLMQAPSLNYEVSAVLQQDGVIDITGFHNQAPHHEVYVKPDGGEWKPIHLAESKGLFWLFDFTSWHYWRYSNMN